MGWWAVPIEESKTLVFQTRSQDFFTLDATKRVLAKSERLLQMRGCKSFLVLFFKKGLLAFFTGVFRCPLTPAFP